MRLLVLLSLPSLLAYAAEPQLKLTGAIADRVLPAAIAADRPSPTIDAILSRHPAKPELMGWGSDDSLLVQYSAGANRTTRELAIATGEESDRSGWIVRHAPGRQRSIEQDAKGWIIRDGTRAVRIPSPTQAKLVAFWKPAWSPDGRYVAVIAATRPDALPKTPAIREVDGVRIMDFADLAREVPTSTAFVSILDVDNLRDAPTPHWIEVTERIGEMAWDADGVYFASAKFHVKEPYTVVCHLRPGADRPREVYRSRGRFQSLHPAPSPDGRLLAMALDVDTRYWDAFTSIVLVDVATGKELRRLTRDVPIFARSLRWSADGSELHCLIRQGGLDQFATVSLDGDVRYRTQGLRKHFNAEMSHDGHRVAYETMDGFGRHDLRTLDLRTDEERVVKVFDDPTEQFSLGEFHHIRFPSTDGISPYAYVFVPRDFDPRKKYPVLVDVHGGGSGSSLYLQAPLTIACSHGPLEWHLWASLGYVVIVPDYRSTGYYGPVPAATKQPRDVTGEDVRDAVSALRFMTSQSFVDPTRTALIGHSAGGARGYRLLTEHPDLFRAALLNEGASPDPLSTMLSLSTGGYTGREFEGVTSDVLGGRLSQIPETYKHNAIFNAYRVRTATLILLGNDALGGVGHLPHQVLYSILRAYGTPTRLLSFVDEGHTYTRRESARLAFREAQRWFEKHLSTEPMPARQASAD